MTQSTFSFPVPVFQQQVRELVCTYRPLRDRDGSLVVLPTLRLNTPQIAARTLTPLLAEELVEVCAVACLSTRCHLLAWHLLSRGSRTSTAVSMADAFVPALITPGTTGLIVLHNHPSGDPTPSVDDVALTRRLRAAAAILGLELLDHLIAGEMPRYYSFREAGFLDSAPDAAPAMGAMAVTNQR